jgi:D-ribose pyranose/furanose isomerase RbsD
MKKSGPLHPELLAVIGAMGHLDEFHVWDAGFPIRPDVPRIDLAYRPACGLPF